MVMKRKRISWAPDIKDPNPRKPKNKRLTWSLDRWQRQDNYYWSRIRRVIQRIEWKSEEDKIELPNFNISEDLFYEIGDRIFSWADVYHDARFYQFILNLITPENISKKCLQEVFRDDDFAILKHFLMPTARLADNERWIDTEQKLRINKFKLLFKIDEQGVEEAFKKHQAEEPYCNKAVQQEYTEAKKLYTQEVEAEKPRRSSRKKKGRTIYAVGSEWLRIIQAYEPEYR